MFGYTKYTRHIQILFYLWEKMCSLANKNLMGAMKHHKMLCFFGFLTKKHYEYELDLSNNGFLRRKRLFLGLQIWFGLIFLHFFSSNVDPQLCHKGGINWSPAVTLSLSSLSFWSRQPVTLRKGDPDKADTDSHSFGLSHLLTENAIVNIQRNRPWVGGQWYCYSWREEREDVERWLVE